MFGTADDLVLSLLHGLQITPHAPHLACNPSADCPNRTMQESSILELCDRNPASGGLDLMPDNPILPGVRCLLSSHAESLRDHATGRCEPSVNINGRLRPPSFSQNHGCLWRPRGPRGKSSAAWDKRAGSFTPTVPPVEAPLGGLAVNEVESQESQKTTTVWVAPRDSMRRALIWRMILVKERGEFPVQPFVAASRIASRFPSHSPIVVPAWTGA